MNLERIINTDIEFIDGDRGQNYPSKSDFFANEYCVFLNTGNITKNGFDFSKLDFITEEKDKSLRKGKVKIDDIILTTRGTVGNVALVTESIKYPNMRINSGMVIIRSKKDFTPLFLNTFFRSELFKKQALTNGSGSAQPQLPISALKNISIPKLDKKTQAKITSVLSALDEKIALNNQINATLEQMAKTLYDYWFVQFDFPDENGKPYKSSGGEMVYNETLKRDIPKGWEVETLDKHISIKRGISYKSHEIQETGTPFLNLNSFYLNGSFKVEGTKFFNGTTKSENLLKTGDLVVAVTDVTRNADIIGKSFIVPNIYEESFLMSCDVAMIKSEKLPNSYLEKLFNSYNYHEYIKHYASGTLVLHLDTKGIGWFETFIPSSNVLKKYDDLVQQIIARKIESIKQNAELTKLRDWLLPMLMNGQITVQ